MVGEATGSGYVLHALIRRLFDRYATDVNHLGAKPTRDYDQTNPDDGKYDRKSLARFTVEAQP